MYKNLYRYCLILSKNKEKKMEKYEFDNISLYVKGGGYWDPNRCLIKRDNSLRLRTSLKERRVEVSSLVDSVVNIDDQESVELYFSLSPVASVLIYDAAGREDDNTPSFLITRGADVEKSIGYLHSYKWIIPPGDGLLYMKYHRVSGTMACFMIDWSCLKEDEKCIFKKEMEAESILKFLIIDNPENKENWIGYKSQTISNVELKEGDDVVLSTFSFIMGEVREAKAMIDKDFISYLLDLATETETLEDIENLIESGGGINTVKEEVYDNDFKLKSLLAIASEKMMSDDILEYLVRNGFSFTVKSNDENSSYDLSVLANWLYDTTEFSRVFAAIMRSGYESSLDELFSVVDTFIDFAGHFDHIIKRDPTIRHDTMSEEFCHALDDIRCREFAEMSPYLPDELFVHRNHAGETLLTIASYELGSIRCLPNLFKMILDRTSDVNLIDEEGHTALDLASDGSFRLMLLERKGEHGITKKTRRKGPAIKVNMPSLLDRELFSIISNYDISTDDESEIESMLSADNKGRLCTDAIDKYGMTAFMNLMELTDYNEHIYDLFLSFGYDVNQKGGCDENALFIALSSPDDTLKKLDFLLKNGADYTQINSDGESIINQAAKLFHIRKEEWDLLTSRIKDESIFIQRDIWGNTPIMNAFIFMNMEAIRALMGNGYVPKEDLPFIRERAATINSPILRKELDSLLKAYDN